MIANETGAVLGLAVSIVLAGAAFVWGFLKAKRRARKIWPCVILPIDEAIRRPTYLHSRY